MYRIILTKNQIKAMAASVDEDFTRVGGMAEFVIEDTNLHGGTTRSLELATKTGKDGKKAVLVSKKGDRMEMNG